MDRWIEVQFLYLILNIHSTFRDIYSEEAYFETLTTLSNLENIKVMPLIRKMYEDLRIRPTKTELISLAKNFNASRKSITKALQISNTHYDRLLKEANTSFIRPPICSTKEIEIMKTLLKTHKKLGDLAL